MERRNSRCAPTSAAAEQNNSKKTPIINRLLLTGATSLIHVQSMSILHQIHGQSMTFCLRNHEQSMFIQKENGEVLGKNAKTKRGCLGLAGGGKKWVSMIGRDSEILRKQRGCDEKVNFWLVGGSFGTGVSGKCAR